MHFKTCAYVRCDADAFIGHEMIISLISRRLIGHTYIDISCCRFILVITGLGISPANDKFPSTTLSQLFATQFLNRAHFDFSGEMLVIYWLTYDFSSRHKMPQIFKEAHEKLGRWPAHRSCQYILYARRFIRRH